MYKKAQVSTGVSWFTATIIIIFILAISIYISSWSGLGGFDREVKIDSGKELFVTKSVSGYFLSSCENVQIYNSIESKLDINNCEGNKANDIFGSLFLGKVSEDKNNFCLGFAEENSFNFIKSSYFGNCRASLGGRFHFDKYGLDNDKAFYIYGGLKNE